MRTGRIIGIALAAVLAALVQSCGCYMAVYSVGLESVDAPVNAGDTFSESRPDNLNVQGNSYEDEYVEITWSPGKDRLDFSLRNKTRRSIKIRWDLASYIGPNGVVSGVIRAGTLYKDRNELLDPVAVPAGATVCDLVMPSRNIHYYWNGYQYEWNVSNLVGSYYSSEEDMRMYAPEQVGLRMTVTLPLEISGNIHEYVYHFKVDAWLPDKTVYLPGKRPVSF